MSNKQETAGSTRRQFCLQALSVAALVPLVEACAGGGNPNGPSGNVPQLPVVNGTLANSKVTVTVDSSSPLNSVGGAALVNYGSGALLVAHVAAGTFNAMSSTCTHQTCTITGYSGGTFVCPCHGSTFNTSGQRTGGPAPSNLPTVNASFNSSTNVLTIG